MVSIIISSVIFVVIMLVFGALYSFVRNISCKNIQKTFGSKGFLIFSFIGTPVHELCHYIACKIFFHKVTEVVLFSPKNWKNSGELGHVNHSFNPRNLYQMAGNFIIGIAPAIGGAGISFLMLRIALGQKINFVPDNGVLSKEIIFSGFEKMKQVFLNIFTIQNMQTPIFWLILFIVINIFLHICLSKADFKNAYVGISFFIFFIITLAYVLNFWGIIDINTFSVFLINLNFEFIFVLIFGLIISFIVMLLSYILFQIKRIYYRNTKNLIIK